MTAIADKHILIVEDEALIAMTAEDIITGLGGVVIGPATTVSEGLRLAESAPIDAALLDVNLNGYRSDAIAHALDQRGIPYVFATGYGRQGVEGFPDAPVIAKPYSAAALAELLGALITRR